MKSPPFLMFLTFSFFSRSFSFSHTLTTEQKRDVYCSPGEPNTHLLLYYPPLFSFIFYISFPVYLLFMPGFWCLYTRSLFTCSFLVLVSIILKNKCNFRIPLVERFQKSIIMLGVWRACGAYQQEL